MKSAHETARETAGTAAAEAWARVGECRKGTPEHEVAVAEWEQCYSAWRYCVGERYCAR